MNKLRAATAAPAVNTAALKMINYHKPILQFKVTKKTQPLSAGFFVLTVANSPSKNYFVESIPVC
jgi:hypothetical protein